MSEAKKIKDFQVLTCKAGLKNLANILINYDEKPILFVDGDHEIEYHVPHINRKCEECFSWDCWVFLESDWENTDTNRKWISFKCVGRIYDPAVLGDLKCENVIRLPLDESLRIKE